MRTRRGTFGGGNRLLTCAHSLGSMPVGEIPRRWVDLAGNVCGKSPPFYFLKEVGTWVTAECENRGGNEVDDLIFSVQLLYL